MRKAFLTRYFQDPNVTLGLLTIDDIEHKPIYTLENPWKDNVRNISCIPMGEYDVEPYDGTKYKDVYIVRNVKDRGAILFHRGNYEKDTRGCILLGLGSDPSLHEPMVTHSTHAINYLRKLMGKDKFKLIIQSLGEYNATASYLRPFI